MYASQSRPFLPLPSFEKPVKLLLVVAHDPDALGAVMVEAAQALLAKKSQRSARRALLKALTYRQKCLLSQHQNFVQMAPRYTKTSMRPTSRQLSTLHPTISIF